VDEAERAVAVASPLLAVALDDHAHRREVVDLVELAALLGHLVVDGIEVLRASGDLRGEVDLLELAREHVRGFRDVALTIGAALGDHRLDLRELARVQRLEREIFELPLERVDAETVRERRVHLERLLRLLDLLLLAEVLDRAHVVQPVRELDQDHADVLGHRDDHLAVVLGLGLLAALEADPGELRDALDEPGDLVAERGAHVVDVGLGVLDDVVEERGCDRLLVQAQLGADAGGAGRVLDEVGAGLALLPLVCGRGEVERARDEVAVDRSRVAGHLGEQLVEETLVPFACLQCRQVLQCTPGLRRRIPPGRRRRREVEMTLLVLGFRRREARKVAKLARAFASLDEQARLVRPARKRVTRLSLGV